MTTPKLRFKGFEEPWEQKKLQDFSEKVNEKNVDNTYKSVFTDSALYGVIKQNDFFKKDIANSKNINKYTIVKDSYYIYNPRISKYAEFGPIRRNKLKQTGVVSPMYFVFKTNKDVSNIFLDNYFLSNHWYSYVYSVGNSGVRSDRIAIKDSDFMNMPILIPNFDEQNKISSLMHNIDNLIEHQNKKIKGLSNIKSGYLQKLFVGENENKPKLRFEGFNDDWKENKVDEIFKVTRGNVLSKDKISEFPDNFKKYPVYSSQTKNNGLLGYYNEYIYEDAITWTTDGANAGTVKFRKGKFYSTNVNGVLLSDDGYNNESVACALNRIAYKYVSHVGNPKLMNNTMSDIRLKLPSIKEQDKISVFLNIIDKQIILQNKKLEQLSFLKKGYLQKIFA